MNRPLKVAINGLGRIGRLMLRQMWDNPAFEFVAICSRSEAATYAYLIEYDSVYGRWNHSVTLDKDAFVIDGKRIPFVESANSAALPWSEFQPDLVIDSSGKYKTHSEASQHLAAGARYVVVTAPVEDADAMLVMGVNDNSFDPEAHKVISAASCTSICSALTVKVLEESFGIERGFINTVHAVTSDQSIHDGSHKDPRRARAAFASIIPTSTGVTKTMGRLFPNLAGAFSGISFRVPVLVPSIVSMEVELKREVGKEEVNDAFRQAARDSLLGHLDVSELPLVSADFKGNEHGAIVDLLSTDVVKGNLANIVVWYDNEWGYAHQVSKLIEKIATKIE